MLTREQLDNMSAGDLAVHNNDFICLVLSWAATGVDIEISGDTIARRKNLKEHI